MPKVEPEYLELRRQQILDASAVCFSRRGFHPTTMQDICREAELSPGAVYRYFPSKESIIHGMCERGGSQKIEAVEDAMETGTTLDAFDSLIETFFLGLDAIQSHADCILRVELIAEASRNDHIREWLTQDLEAVRNRFAQLIRSGQEKGEIDPSLDVSAVAQVMVALFHGYVTQKLVDPEMNANHYAEVIRSLFAGQFWRAGADRNQSPEIPAS
jgi:AcrR family transcriptional regulator